VQTMSFSTSIRAGGGSVIGETGSFEADELLLVTNQVDANDELSEGVTLDVSRLEALYIYSDKEIIVTPMNGLSATVDGPFTIPAKKAMWWNTERQEACPLTADITALSFDNGANDTAANVKCGFLVHAT
jgi:hypothetical protein